MDDGRDDRDASPSLELVAPSEEGSPKRSRIEAPQSMAAVDGAFWDRIQSCVAAAVTSSLNPLKEGLQHVSSRTDHTEAALREMGTRFEQHVANMEEKNGMIKGRLDELQEKLEELKERSPGTSPKSSHPKSPIGPASPTRPPSYLIIIGGWKEGERKDYLDTQLPRLFSSSGVSSLISEVQMFGKRPRCAKICLKFESEEPTSKRELQQFVISKLRAQQWTPRECTKPVWITQDRTPAQRAMNKAVAIIGSFLQTTMKVNRDSFEIDNWQAARTYVGDNRISGAYPGPVSTPPPRADPFVVWPVRDHASGVSVWCDLQGIASFLHMEVKEVKKLWDHHSVPQQ